MFKYKNYVHFDFRKTPNSIENIVKNPEIVTRHGFFPFLRFDMNLNKYKRSNGNDHKIVIDKVRNIYYASHIDRYIYINIMLLFSMINIMSMLQCMVFRMWH